MSTLAELVLIAVGSAIVNNVVLSQFLGICPFLGVSKKTETAAGMGGAVIFVITISSFITGLIYKFILANPFLVKKGIDLTYLKTIVFILVIAALVQFVEMFLKKSMPSLYQSLGVYLPLITTNCAVLGVALNCVTYDYNLLEGVVYGFSTAFGFFIAIVLMAGIREKIEYNDIPKTFRGTAIVLITACHGIGIYGIKIPYQCLIIRKLCAVNLHLLYRRTKIAQCSPGCRLHTLRDKGRLLRFLRLRKEKFFADQIFGSQGPAGSLILLRILCPLLLHNTIA